ncbi:hypothetical protein H0266_08795 [Halobacillus locisalis]|uniref:Uncharacterized protein n=1 Tax=Halobacillus locisalis TaxID=220753 RepID=A0A838CSW6_9BACI|nr:hypothetical protein [Halobacillus locisalis]MBA2174988.1 hypothetical protein [Halobacillus locisalis]
MTQSRRSVERGQSITFRVPSDTPDHLLKQLSHLKETERRNFSSKIAQFVLEGVNQSLSKEKETITVPLPKSLSKEQRNWIKHEHSEALIGSILYQLLMDPMRATSLLASLNSNATDIDEALYLQEEAAAEEPEGFIEEVVSADEETINTSMETSSDEDLADLSLDNLQVDLHTDEVEDDEEDDEDPLGDFLSRMNQ